VNDVAATAGTALLELLGLLDDELLVPLLPQAARRRAALPATAVNATLLDTEYNQTTSLIGGTRQDAVAPWACPHGAPRAGTIPEQSWENTRPTGINVAVNIFVTV